MIIQCTKCLARFKFNEERLKDGPKKVRCTKCSEVFTVLPTAVTPSPEPPPVKGTPSRIPTGHTLGRHPTGEQPRRPSADDLLQSPVKARRPSGDRTDHPDASGARRALAGAGKRPPTSAASDPGRSGGLAQTGKPQPSFSPLADAPSGPPATKKQDDRPVFMTLSGITAYTDEEANLPPRPAGPAPIASTKGAVSLDPTKLERPPEEEQTGINEELYKQSDLKLELPPLVKLLREVDFDADPAVQSDLLELDMGREFEYGGDNPRASIRKHSSLKIRPLTGARDDSIPLRTNLSRISSVTVKTLLIAAILLVGLGTLLMLSKGESFNLERLTSLSGLLSLVSDGLSGGAAGS